MLTEIRSEYVENGILHVDGYPNDDDNQATTILKFHQIEQRITWIHPQFCNDPMLLTFISDLLHDDILQ